MTVLVDHGKLLVDYISMYGSYLDGEKLVVVPLGFEAADGKTSEQVYEKIIPNVFDYRLLIQFTKLANDLKSHQKKWLKIFCVPMEQHTW